MWTNTRLWSFGDVFTEDFANDYLTGNLDELRGGGLALASQAAGDLITAASATQLGRVAAVTSGQVLVSQGVNTPPAYSADYTTATLPRKGIAETISGAWDFSAGITISGGNPQLDLGATTGTIDAGSGIILTVNSIPRLALSATSIGYFVPVELVAGTVSSPALSFGSDLDTGIWQSSADRVDIATGGGNRLSIQSTFVEVVGVPVISNTGAFRGPAGSVTSPSFTLATDTDTGMYGNGSDSLLFTCGGADALTLNSAGSNFLTALHNSVMTTGTGISVVWQTDPLGRLVRQTSSARYKQDIEEAQLDTEILKLRPATFAYRSAPERRHLGLIAEDVADVMPDAVHRDPYGRPESIDQGALNAYIIAAVQSLSRRVSDL